jgi:hypothetical protein
VPVACRIQSRGYRLLPPQEDIQQLWCSKKNKKPADKESEDNDQEDQGRNAKYQDASKTINVIFRGDGDFGSRRNQKLLLREIMSIEPAVPQPLRWSEVPISFSHDDQWTSFSEPGKFPLVLDLVVAEVRLTKVLIDGGSGLNLIFASTLRKMGLDFADMMVPSKSPFYRIVPGNAVHPLGTVVLPVTFGTRENYRTEFIKFEVANFESSYHAILGRPALAKFMVVPDYVYLLLKMPGLSGVLTLRGDLKKSYDCNQEAIRYASTTRVPDASGEVLAAAQQLSQSGWRSLRRRPASRAFSRLTTWPSRRSNSRKVTHLRPPSSARA